MSNSFGITETRKEPADWRGRGGRILRVVLGIVIGIAFVVALSKNVNYGEVRDLVRRATLWPLIVAIAAFALDFLLRAVRFWAILKIGTGNRLPLGNSIAPFIASFGLSDILPLRAGDGFRVLWFSRGFDIPVSAVIGAMIFERILDLVTVALLGAFAMTLIGGGATDPVMKGFRLILLAALMGGTAMLLLPAPLGRLLERLGVAGRSRLLRGLLAMTNALERLSSWRLVGPFMLVSLALWLLESIVLYGAWLSLGGAVSAFVALLLPFTFSTLGTLIPSLPGHFGSYEFFGVQAFRLIGVKQTFAMAVLLLTHLILWAPTALFAMVWVLRNGGVRVRKAA